MHASPSPRGTAAALVVAVFATLSACTDPQSPRSIPRFSDSGVQVPQGVNKALSVFPDLPDSLPEVRIAERDRPIRLEPTDAALVEEVARAGGQVLVGLKPASSHRTRETGIVPGINRATALASRAAIRAFGAQIVMTFRNSSAVAATIAPALAPALRRLPVVDYVEPIFPATLMAQDTSWGVKRINAPGVWAGLFGLSTRGEGVNVTILDAGVDESHRWWGDGPANMFTDCLWVEGSGASCYADQLDPDRRGHGAHVAGIIASLDNGVGYIGTAYNLQRFASIKVCDSSSNCLPTWVAAGLDWVLSSGRPRHIVNMSLGWCTNYTVMSQMVANAANAGVLMVASAGNYHRDQPLHGVDGACGLNEVNDLGAEWPTGVYFPARYSQVMAVSGTLEDDAFAVAPPLPPGGGGESGGGGCGGGDMCGVPDWCYIGSRHGSQVDVAAPFWAPSMWSNGSYKSACGTSMSAPYVAGVAALVWSHDPGMTAFQVRERLKLTALHLYPTDLFGSGRVDAQYATYYVPPPPTLAVSVTGPNPVPASSYCVWSAAASGGTEPYAYAWTLDGVPVGDGSNTLSIMTPWTNFALTVVATDPNGLAGGNGVTVSVGGVTSCNAQ